MFHAAKARCEANGIYVGAIDDDDINATAFEHNGSECIGITRGAYEQLDRALALVASCVKEPFFDPQQLCDDVKRIEAKRFRKGSQNELHLSREQHALWQALMDIAIVFILQHELGHLESGHIYWLKHGLKVHRAALFEHPTAGAEMLDIDADSITALEIDADTDAITATLTLLDARPQGRLTEEWSLWADLLASYRTRYPIVDIAINVVFMLLSYRTEPVQLYRDSHPHPDLRSAYCDVGISVYCSQPGEEEALRAYQNWRASAHLGEFFWEMGYVLSGPYHLHNYLANADALRGTTGRMINQLWEHSRPVWDMVAPYAASRRRKLQSSRKSK